MVIIILYNDYHQVTIISDAACGALSSDSVTKIFSHNPHNHLHHNHLYTIILTILTTIIFTTVGKI